MNNQQEVQAVDRRERRIDEALMETFPASDPPSFIGAGAPLPTNGKSTVGKPDLDRVNIHDPDELRGWCAYWGCAPDELEIALEDVGVMVANVEAQLRAKGHKRHMRIR
jgi:hypothetical protein